jgi:hypothetical protein
VTVETSWSRVPASDWDALVGQGSPFLEHAFLWTLEDTGCATEATGWAPRPVMIRDDSGRLVAGAPAWIKTHSMGDFVYDHGWAESARRARIPYHPKVFVGVPFTPVTGDRLLASDASVREVLLGALAALARSEGHGLHVAFASESDAAFLAGRGLFERLQYQFHWENAAYATFDDFLARFGSKLRSEIRRERKKVAHLAYAVEIAPPVETLDALYTFYADTTSRHGPWGHRYLSRAFFRALGERWGHRLHAVTARDRRGVLAGAFNVTKGDRLYGRTWGAREAVPYLHFEVCCHRPVEWAIANGIAAFEPGHGGEHKYRRGFLPRLVRSLHALEHPGLHDALAGWSAEQAIAVREEAKWLAERSPFR